LGGVYLDADAIIVVESAVGETQALRSILCAIVALLCASYYAVPAEGGADRRVLGSDVTSEAFLGSAVESASRVYYSILASFITLFISCN